MSNELRDKLAQEYFLKINIIPPVDSELNDFRAGWDACEKHYKAELDAHKEQNYLRMMIVQDQLKFIDKQSEIIKVLKEALEFYANTLSWTYVPAMPDDNRYSWFRPIIDVEKDCDHVHNDEWCSYGGKTARKALAKVAEMEKG